MIKFVPLILIVIFLLVISGEIGELERSVESLDAKTTTLEETLYNIEQSVGIKPEPTGK